MKIPVGLSVLVAACLVSASPASAQTCGDYVLDTGAGEQCDDGNGRNLDGCDAACNFEQTHRINNLKLQRTTDTVCAANAFGSAFTNTGLNNTQPGIDATVASGDTSILLHMVGLGDLSGTDDPALSVGVLSATPLDRTNPSYNGTNDLDWWYAVDKTLIDAQRQPLNQLTGSVAGNILTAGPGAAVVKLILSGGSTSLAFSNLVATVTTGASTTPASSTGAPPGHLAVEHVDPALQSFATAGVATTNWGTLCGNISAQSLRNTPIPAALTGAGCSNRFTAANSDDLILDDGFDSGDVSGWSAANTGGGDLVVSPAAALVPGSTTACRARSTTRPACSSRTTVPRTRAGTARGSTSTRPGSTPASR